MKAFLICIFVINRTTICQNTTTTLKPSTDANDDGFVNVQYIVPPTNADDNERELVLWQELKNEIQTLKKSRDRDSKILSRLQQENKNLKSTMIKLEQKTIADARNSTFIVNSAKLNDKIIRKMSSDLENLKGNLNYWLVKPNVSRKRRDDDDVDNHLYSEVEGLKQEITAIKLLEDEQLPMLITNLTEHGRTLDLLLNATKSLEDKLSNTEPIQLVNFDGHVDTQIELDKMDIRISSLGGFANNLQDKVFDLTDKYKWYSFLVEHFNTELHIVKNELYKMMNLFYNVNDQKSDKISPKVVPNIVDGKIAPNLVDDNVERSGDGDDGEPFVFVPDDKKPKQNLRQELNQMSMKINDAFSGVHQLLTRMNSLEAVQTNFERRFVKMKEEKSDTSAIEQCFTKVGQVKSELSNVTNQLNSLKSKLIDVNTLISGDVSDLRKEINGCSLKCDRARKLAEVVKEHQTGHFTAIQEMKQIVNELNTGSKIITVKLATLQSDFLNATLTTYKDFNKELKQDLQIGKLESELDRMEKKFGETQDSLKNVFSSLRQKADRSDFKRISDDVDKTNEKMQLVKTISNSLTTVEESVTKLESQLPRDCSMRTTPAKAGAYKSGVYLIKPGKSSDSVKVKCDMETDGGYWTVIQQRLDGRESFNKTWSTYASGFGDPEFDYWLGNKVINVLTSNDDYQLKIDVWDIFDDHYFALYDNFIVSSPTHFYSINVGSFSGNLTDSLSYHKGMKFSSIDKDLDVSSTNCAKFYESGWWFSHCHMANLNGNFDIGMIWFNNRTQDWMQMKRTVMKIRPKNF